MEPVAPPDNGTAVKSFISVSPYSYAALDDIFTNKISGHEVSISRSSATLQQRTQRPYKLTNSGRHSIRLILEDLRLQPSDVITIVTTSGGNYVSSCVTSAIEGVCQWSMGMESNTKAVFVIHEWGRACERISEYEALGIPIIEDCAYAFGTRYSNGELVGRRGDYVLYSLTKVFSTSFGGMVVFPLGRIADYAMPEQISNSLLFAISAELHNFTHICELRAQVWQLLCDRFSSVGAHPFFEPVPGEFPAVYMFAHDPSRGSLANLRARFGQHGVEASVFYGANAFFIPCHQRLGPAACELMFQIYKSFLIEHRAL